MVTGHVANLPRERLCSIEEEPVNENASWLTSEALGNDTYFMDPAGST